MLSVNFFCNISSYDILAYITKNYIVLIYYAKIVHQDLLYCNSSQYILSTYNSQHNNNNNVVLAMTMPYSGQG